MSGFWLPGTLGKSVGLGLFFTAGSCLGEMWLVPSTVVLCRSNPGSHPCIPTVEMPSSRNEMAEAPGDQGVPRRGKFIGVFVPLQFIEVAWGPANEVLKMDCGWPVLLGAHWTVNYLGKLERNEYFIKQKPTVSYSLFIYKGQL